MMTFMRSFKNFVFLIFILWASNGFGAADLSASKFQALQYRNIGPTRGGRATAVSGIPGQPNSFLMGSAGGLWKTVNSGESWENISDGFFDSSSIGAIAVAQSDPNVIYVGTGQATLRGNVTEGVGVYKSVDGGKAWRHVGLRQVGQIARIRIDPHNPDVVYVAAVGNAFAPNDERGVFRSSDGGKNWQKILFISSKTGVIDLSIDPSNPRVLYAAAWTGQRKPWTIVSGSEESGLYKTVDGGDHWIKLVGGLPQGVVGKIGVAISPANPNRIWAIVEASEGGVFRSDDSGNTWKKLQTNMKRRLLQRAWYYMHIFADPKDEEKVYVLNVDEFRSRDGGQTFETIDVPHGDGHDLWINPDDTRIMIMSSDGGACISQDDGKTWSSLLNQPTAEIYYVTVDDQFPYRIYGAQQDNTTVSLPSRMLSGLSPYEYWKDVGGCEDGNIAVDPRNPKIVYAGCYGGEITRTNVETGETRNILTYPQMEVGLAPRDLRYRFNWNSPIRVSRHHPEALYHASQFIHRSTNEGQSWEVVSPDLSRDDKAKEDYSGEPITYENTGVEVYANVLSFEESPVRAGVLWAGSDDGLVHVSTDDGKSWKKVTPAVMPEWGKVNSIEPSVNDAATAYIAVLKYQLGDKHPYIFKTSDTGKSWTLLTNGKNGIPADLPARVVRQDPKKKGLLYAGTESGIYVSFNDGGQWQSLQLNLPVIPVTDLRIHDDDLIASTQGRSFWILDDLSVVRQFASSNIPEKQPYLFQPRPTSLIRQSSGKMNPPSGALIFYQLPESVKDEVALDISDASGKLIQTFSSEHDQQPNPQFVYDFMGKFEGDNRLSKKPGLNRFVWDLRTPAVDFPEGTVVWGYLGGARVEPGSYQATLRIGNWKQTQTFLVVKDPRVSATQKDLEEQYAFMQQVREELNRIYKGVRSIRSVRKQSHDAVERLALAKKDNTELKKLADSLSEKLNAIENELMQPRNEADQDTENFPTKIDNQLAYVYMLLNYTDSKPTDGERQRVADLEKEMTVQLDQLEGILSKDVQEFNRKAAGAGVAAITLAASP
jgi:photosystem II stability/assembly factor-like uncharacterized protein